VDGCESLAAGAFDEGSAGLGAPVKMPYGIANLIAALCNHVAIPGGCVLVFLPGIGEIELAAEAVERCTMAQRGQGLATHSLTFPHSMPVDPNTLALCSSLVSPLVPRLFARILLVYCTSVPVHKRRDLLPGLVARSLTACSDPIYRCTRVPYPQP
jgi:hypothetical protein